MHYILRRDAWAKRTVNQLERNFGTIAMNETF